MTKRTHTYSDGSRIELGAEPGKGWLATLAARSRDENPAPRKRRIIGRTALRVDDVTRPE